MYDYRLPYDERLRIELAAPVIVLGKVLAVTEVGEPKKSPGDPRIKTQLTRIKIDAEQAIRGVAPGPMEFYFFTYAMQNTIDLGVPRYIPEVGQHRIYFLKRWENTHRSIGDVTNYHLPVRTGTHAAGFCQGKEPGCCIAELLLTPAKGVDKEWFVHQLGHSAYSAGVRCSPGKAQDLLRQLERNPDVQIANGARDAMSMLKQSWPQPKSSGR